jgi:hypothetical protein
MSISRLGRILEYNIEIDLKEAENEDVDLLQLAHYRESTPDSCEEGNELSGSIKCGQFFN